MKEIPLTKGHVALVDDEDYEYLSQYNWHAIDSAISYAVYAARWIRVDGKRISWKMHHAVLGIKPPVGPFILIDHEDRNGCNNQKHNLRHSNKSQNAINSERVEKANRVYYDQTRRRYKAFLPNKRILGKAAYVGTFRTRTEAEEALAKAREEVL